MSSETRPTAEEVYRHHVTARGGQAALDAIFSIIERGTYAEGDHKGKATLARMRPWYKLVGDPDALSPHFREGNDGSPWEFYGDPGIVLRTVGAAAGASRHGQALFGPLIDYEAQGSTIELLANETIDRRDAYRLRIRMMDGFEEDQFIDAGTWLLLATRKVAKVHAFGTAIASETRWSDWRRQNGVLFPFRAREVEIASGKELNRFETATIAINVKIDPAAFSPPSFQRTPLQNLIETLFVERDDPSTVLWVLHDFRRAHSDISTDSAIQVAGFQILKMGQVATATALLEENARAFPQSSGAAFGLGRAYQAAGAEAKARSQFERARQLDPSNTRAADALKALGSWNGQ